jgi:N-acetylmuramate 1-kinase
MTSIIEPGLSKSVLELAARHLNSDVEALTVYKLAGDASTRSYFRVRNSGSTVIVVLYSDRFDENESASDRLRRFESSNPSARLTFANDPCAHIEVTNLFVEAGLPVPRVFCVSGANRILLLEDVGDTRLQDWLSGQSEAEVTARYRRAVEMIVTIQEATDLATSPDSICSQLAFDPMKLKWELGFFFANYFNRYLGLKLDATTSNHIQEEFTSICTELAARPRVLVHRDYHARNLMLYRDQMFIIDHQDARMGPASYDLASLISDPYAALDARIAQQMANYFIECKAGSRVSLGDVDLFRTELELMTVQRMLKAVGTYASQAVANNPVYIPYLLPAIESAIRSMEALGRFDRTRAVLEKTRADLA